MALVISKSEYIDLLGNISPAKCLAVSKGSSASDIENLLEYGQLDFAENYLQELQDKQKILQNKNIIWHFTGRLQSNKCKYLANSVDYIHSVNCHKKLLLLDKYRRVGEPLKCLLQVLPPNFKHDYAMSFEQAKKCISSYANISVLGVMVMPPAKSSQQEIQDIFRLCQEFAIKNWHNPEISMGMSSDFKFALEYGSTMIRLGGFLFNK